MAVNGVEIRVGQRWRNRDGDTGVVSLNKNPMTKHLYPFRIDREYGGHFTVNADGRYGATDACERNDLVALVEDVPANESLTITPPPAVAEVDANALAAETLQALGWHFVGNCWVQEKPESEKSALDTQVDGSHYKDCGIQPVEYIHANELGYAEGNVIKYVTRHKKKNGAADLKKAIHYLQIALQQQYGVSEK